LENSNALEPLGGRVRIAYLAVANYETPPLRSGKGDRILGLKTGATVVEETSCPYSIAAADIGQGGDPSNSNQALVQRWGSDY
jgi:hypothetical protein